MNEIYKPISFNNNYSISNFGNVKNNKTNRILKNSYNNGKYAVVCLHNENGDCSTFCVHRLVYNYFVNPNNNEIITHKDNDKKNNNINNLILKKNLIEKKIKKKHHLSENKKIINNNNNIKFINN
jgi:hypothetical protein